MPNFEQQKQEPTPEQKIAELEAQIKKIEAEKDQALAVFGAGEGKKKKEKKKEAPRMDLPDSSELRKIDFVKDENGKFHFEAVDKNNNRKTLSPGDLITDLNWGIYYDLNHEVLAQEYRTKYDRFRKKYLEAVYQKKVEKLFTEQLIIRRLDIDRIADHDYYLGQAYQGVYDRLKESDATQETQAGFLFEKMIEGILTKVAFDLGEKFGFKIKKADVIDDVELKTDLIVMLPERNRGVGVEESEKAKGIQLTLIDQDNEKFQRKVKQVEKVKEAIKESKRHGEKNHIDDLVILEVEVKNKQISDLFEQWKNNGKRAGGPENLFSTEKIVGEFLKGIFKNTDLDLDLADNKKFHEELWDYFERKR